MWKAPFNFLFLCYHKKKIILICEFFSAEEILSSNSALWFSPDGGRLAFATFNDTRVDTMNFPLYGQPGELPFQYPFQQSIKYPKVRENILRN